MKTRFALSFVAFVLFATATLVIQGSCTAKKAQKTPTTKSTFMANYDSLWASVDSLDKNQLYQSALKEVDVISQVAKDNGDSDQWIKTVIYKVRYAQFLSEDNLVDAIAEMETELEQAEEPARSILYSLGAEMYMAYLNQRAHILADQTTFTTSRKTDDISTWSAGELIEQINNYYLESVQNQGLKEEDIAAWETVLVDGSEFVLKPTLFDLLAHRAIAHFMSDLAFVSDPAYRGRLYSLDYLAPASVFVNMNIDTAVNAGMKVRALALFQELIAMHLNDEEPHALVHTDLQRLRFVRGNLVHEQKDEAYKNALEGLSEIVKDSPAWTEVRHALASYIAETGAVYNPEVPGADTLKWKLKAAVDLCVQAIDRYPKSYGAQLCRQMIQNMEQTELSIRTEEVSIPGENILALITYRNVPTAHIRVVAVDNATRQVLREHRDEPLEVLRKLKTVQSKRYELPGTVDLRSHSLEIPIEPLPTGVYAVMISDGSGFKKGTNSSYAMFHVSNLAWWGESSPNYNQLLVVDRTSGKPVEGALVEMFTRNWDRNERRTTYKLETSGTTDDQGVYDGGNWPSKKTLMPRVSLGSDTLFLDNGNVYSYRTHERSSRDAVLLFTDRAIYRPGQTVYFKGYAVRYDPQGIPSILTGREIELQFKDANWQKVEGLTASLNEYGTFSGSFVIPEGRLTGQMSINAVGISGTVRFNVEEYKRPTFEVTFEPVTGKTELGDSVSLTGKARTYAGVPVQDAEVSYRVVRRTRYPWFPWWLRSYYPVQSDELEILSGETTTDEDGNFTVTFHARSDASALDRWNPQFVFSTSADVTNMAGETRIGSSDITLNATGFRASTDIPAELDISGWNGKVPVNVSNLQGEPFQAGLALVVERLNAPDRLLRDRLWGQPDEAILSKEDFVAMFPDYAPRGAENPWQWEVESTVGQHAQDITGRDTLDLGRLLEASGVFKVTTVFTSANGNTVEQEFYVEVYNSSTNDINPHKPWIIDVPKVALPGDEVNYNVLTEHDLHVRLVNDRRDKAEVSWRVPGTDGTVSTGVRDSDRGGIRFSALTVSGNRFYVKDDRINVPWTNKQLDIEYITYRDVTSPGAEEEWMLRITGEDKEPVMAEMLATMYDASLDAFLPHNWRLSLFPSNYRKHGWNTSGFLRLARTTYLSSRPLKHVSVRHRVEPEINWFGYLLYSNRLRSRLAGAGGVVMRAPEMLNEVQVVDGVRIEADEFAEAEVEKSAPAADAANEELDGTEQGTDQVMNPVAPAIRSDLEETVFFKPHVYTDREGRVVLRFKMRESLTRYKFMAIAHSKELQYGLSEMEIESRKDLMVFPHMPRFVRQQDTLVLTATIFNSTDKALQGSAELKLFDAFTGGDISSGLIDGVNTSSFSTDANGSAVVRWEIRVSSDLDVPIRYQVIATSDGAGDGEEGILPVLTNKIFVTESIPLYTPPKAQKSFALDAFDKPRSDAFLPHGMTVEYTSNPSWYAVKSLPYLMEFPHECVEQQFNRLYANLIGRDIIEKNPLIEQVFEEWRASGNAEDMMSQLSKNQDLKNALLEESPWVRDALAEEEQLADIARLFDRTELDASITKILRSISQAQLPNGGLPWFAGGRDNRYITQYIVEGFGHLEKLGIVNVDANPEMKQIVNEAVKYIDQKMLADYERILRDVKAGHTTLEDNHLSPIAAHYLYARTFFMQYPIPNEDLHAFYLRQAHMYWQGMPMYTEGLLYLAMTRNAVYEETTDIMLQSFEERSIYDEERGRFWKAENGYSWYNLQIERHALFIELFTEAGANPAWVDQLRQYLLVHKRTNSWESTKATSAAIYGLLMQPDNWLEGELATVKVGDQVIAGDDDPQAGSLYIRQFIEGKDIDESMGVIQVDNPNDHGSWGGVYFQYFESIDAVHEDKGGPLSLTKYIGKQIMTDAGPRFEPLGVGHDVKVGDRLLVRLEVSSDREMEFIHLKDLRGSGLEPENVLSGWRWEGGLGVYESTRDLATHFFIDHLPRGTWVIEYPVRVAHAGSYSNGIATLGSMYAPEFSAHSASSRILAAQNGQ